jgi:hypothetical protein
MLKPGGVYIFVGMVHPHSKLDITGEQIIRKCLMIKGKKTEQFIPSLSIFRYS